MRIARIDMEKQEVRYEVLEGEDRLRGGRGLTGEMVAREVPPLCDPLGPHNKLVFAAGLLAGAGASSGSRISVGTKSPLTGGIKEANAGGVVADAMARNGLRAIVLEQAPAPGSTFVLVFREDGVSFEDAAQYRGLGNFALAEALQKKYGTGQAIISCGPAGEMGMLGSGVSFTDMVGRQSRLAARGGVGAVMGAGKGVRAIVIPLKGGAPMPGRDRAEYIAARKAYNDCIRESDRPKTLRKYGTADTLMPVQKLGALPTRNFRQGTFEKAQEISAEALYELIATRGGAGKHSEACMPGCLVQCSNVVPGPDGSELVAPLEYETLALLGSNLGLGSLDEISRLNWLANDLGLDTIELGGSLGVMAEAGMVEFGDFAGFQGIVEEVYQGKLRGRLAGNGAQRAGEILGVRRIPTVKSQTMSAYDPRGVKGTGVTYATSAMGADHTAGLTVFVPRDHHAPDGWVEISRGIQVTRALYDIVGLCAFVSGATGSRPELLVDMVNGYYGTSETAESLDQRAWKLLQLERAYNHRCGLGPGTDRIPEFMTREKLPPFDLVWDVPDREIDAMWGEGGKAQ